MKESKPLKMALGLRMHGALMEKAEFYGMTLTQYVRFVLANHIREDKVVISEPEEPSYFRPFGA